MGARGGSYAFLGVTKVWGAKLSLIAARGEPTEGGFGVSRVPA